MKAAIAREYYQTDKTLRQIALKYEVTYHQAQYMVKKFEPSDFREDIPMTVIKVEHKWVDHVVELLARRGINVEVPKDYELIEKFQSKMNK